MTKRADQQFLRLVNDQKWADALQFIRQDKVDLNAQNQHGSTALHLASRQPVEGRQAFMQALLDQGADPRRYNHKGHYPAHVSLINADWGGWTFWTTHDPTLVNASTQEGFSSWWVGYVHMETVHPFTEETFHAWMLQHGVNVAHVEPSGRGALMFATGDYQSNKAPDYTMLDDLLARSAPVITLSVRDSKSPLTEMAMIGDLVMVDRLLDRGEQEAAQAGGPAMDKWHQVLANTLYAVMLRKPEGTPPPAWSASRPLLLDHLDQHHPGLINRPLLADHHGTLFPVMHTLMRQAISGSHVDSLKLLVDHGADITLMGPDGKTPAQLAQNLDDREWLVLRETLLDAPTEPRVRRRM